MDLRLPRPRPSPSVAIFEDMAQSNSIYGALADELSTLPSYDLYGKVINTQFRRAGGYSDVFDGMLEYNPQPWSVQRMRMKVAVKRFRFWLNGNTSIVKTIVKELQIWISLKHDNIIPCLGFTVIDSLPGFVSEWMENGDLSQYLVKDPDSDRRNLVYEIACGVEYLHSRKIVHSDLKCVNILVTPEGRPMLSDFGISRALVESGTVSGTRSLRGTMRWMAAELIVPTSSSEADGGDCQLHTKETDVWAFGMVIYEIVSGKVPFYTYRTDATVLLAIVNGVLPERPSHDVLGLDLLWRVCSGCWAKNPADRPTMKEILRQMKKTNMELLSIYDDKPHSDAVCHIVFSPVNSLTFATSSYDKLTYIWDLSPGDRSVKLRHSLSGHTWTVEALTWSMNGQYLFSGSWDTTVRKWDPWSGECKLVMKTSYTVACMASSPDDVHIASNGKHGTVHIWDTSSGDEFMRLARQSSNVVSLVYSPDGRRIITGTELGQITIWETSTGASIYGPMEPTSFPIRGLSFQPSGNVFQFSSLSIYVAVYDANTFEPIYAHRRRMGDSVPSEKNPRDGKFVARLFNRTDVSIWDARTCDMMFESTAIHGWDIWFMSFSPCGRWFACGSVYGHLRIWEIHESEVFRPM